MDLLSIVFSIFKDVPKELSIGRMLESIIVLSIVWSKLKPHLEIVQKRLEGLEKAVQNGFINGDQRFKAIEGRVTTIEKNMNEGDRNGTFKQTSHS